VNFRILPEQLVFLATIFPMNPPGLHIRNVALTRYVTPLREGGSLPAIMEADDGFMYVVKFRGAGQGTKALIAELIGGEITRFLGFKVPEIVFAYLDEGFGRTEGDEEIQDLLKFSTGLNLGVHYLSGAISFDPAVNSVDPITASGIVWLDAYLMNVDRTARNTNMLTWYKDLWLIDHGASLYFHHNWESRERTIQSNFPQIKDHVLLPWATEIDKVNEEFTQKLNSEFLHSLTSVIPSEFLSGEDDVKGENKRGLYLNFLTERLKAADKFVTAIKDARKGII
jgi:hypothetical protein